MIKKMIDLKTQDGLCDTYIAYPEDKNNLPIVICYMDAVGLRQRMYDMADKIAQQGYFVVMPNIFYRSHRVPIVDYKTLLTPENLPELFKQVMGIASQLTVDMAKSDAQEFLSYAKSQPQVNPKKIGAVGYCMGGGQALRSAGNFPNEFLAAASFHAGNLAVDTDTSPRHWFPKIKAEIYIGHADNDRSMPAEQIERVKKELQECDANFTAELYHGCAHGWTMADLPAYNKEGEEQHWKKLFALFERTLKN
jgi:carboxymethylenebutenolidase